MTVRFRHAATFSSLALILISLNSCTSARVAAMVPSTFDLAATHPVKVRVGFRGESVRSSLSEDPDAATFFGSDDATDINGDRFMEAVIAGVRKSGVFREVVTDGESDFNLEVNIVSEIKPGPGIRMKSTVVTSWRLTRTQDRKVVLDDLIETVGKATPFSCAGIRTAKEASVRRNIERGVQSLSRAKL